MPPFVPPPFILMFLSSTNWFIWEKITNPLFGLDPLHGSKPEQKTFFRKTVHTVHCAFLFIKFIMLHGERLVNSEHFTVHFCRFAGKKTGDAGQGGYFAMGSSHFGSQSALLSSLSARLVCMP